MSNNLKPGMKYQWSPGANFQITDTQFSTLFHSLNNIVQSPTFQQKLAEAQQTIAIAQLQTVMNDILSASVDSGVATEVPVEDTAIIN